MAWTLPRKRLTATGQDTSGFIVSFYVGTIVSDGSSVRWAECTLPSDVCVTCQTCTQAIRKLELRPSVKPLTRQSNPSLQISCFCPLCGYLTGLTLGSHESWVPSTTLFSSRFIEAILKMQLRSSRPPWKT